jgi:hypothetical protein
MKSVVRVIGLTAILWAVGVSASYAGAKCPGCGSPAPAPEIGASAIGMLMAAGFAVYARRQRR